MFTDTYMCRSAAEGIYPLRDMFPHFIAPAAPALGGLCLASRCTSHCPPGAGLDPLTLSESLSFEALPFYANTEDFYRKRALIYGRSKRRMTQLIRDARAVIVRVHHAMGADIARIARNEKKPLMAYWAGATVFDTSRSNYPGIHPKHFAARLLARWKHIQHRRIAAIADWNFFIDPVEYEEMGAPLRSQWVLPNLVEDHDIVSSATERRSERLEVVFAGRIYRHKGIFELLDAVKALTASGRMIRLRYAGDGPHFGELKDRIVKERLEGAVELVGPLRRDRLLPFLREADVFVLPSYGEGLPKTLWEAWASGLACILTPVGAIPTHVADGEDGMLVPVGSVSALAAAIDRLYVDEQFRLALATAGMDRARRHTWDREIAAIVEGVLAVAAPPHFKGETAL
ncbi:hypothetical protein CKO31_17285 [Thiohalocapsa halophila]|uniref:Glycosyltransferase family 4 protein n=2 Tax=Thiohalocapsa halophila TaxID=69359 RepID=A0ABS1CKN6_9GAMM|nr:hypothetical protein [Thiohalocapsa halophila]